MKELLILGGTHFVRRNLIERLIPSDQYNITLFNRGITNPELFSEPKRIKGDQTNLENMQKMWSQGKELKLVEKLKN